MKRKLLRSCIALTAAVRSNEEQLISVAVDVDTLTFDRHAALLQCFMQSRSQQLPTSFAL